MSQAVGPQHGARSANYCGPEHLARSIRMFRRWEASSASEGKLDQDMLLRLVELAYGVSLTTEEGRHPRFAVFVPAPAADGHVKLLARFEPPVTLTLGALRRLAPSVPLGLHALFVVEREGRLDCDGIMAVHDANDVPQIGGPLVSFGLGLPGLSLRVDGPGQLRATENGLTWELRSGTIRPVYHYAVLAAVQQWFQLLALNLVDEYRSEASELTTRVIHQQEELGDPALIFDSVWSSILASTLAAGHGGAFVILPDDALDGIEVKYGAQELDLSAEVLDFWQSCFDGSRVPSAELLESKTIAWEGAREKLYTAARALANLANVDGCVVLDRRLKLLGFGGEIRVTAGEVSDSGCYDADRRTMALRGRVDLQQFGTRHRSAYRLCARRPGTLAFVISQDRALRVFYGHREQEGQVCLWRSLGVWMAGTHRV